MFFNLTKNYNQFICSIGNDVIAGPFKGMKYILKSIGSCYMPKILGIYEKELYPTLTKFLSTSDMCINIGAAEGYYAIGCALKFPKLQVIAYEMDERGRECMLELKNINLVNNVKIKNKFTCLDFDSIQNISNSRVTYLIDIEGDEKHIFSQYYSHFNNSNFIIELHDEKSKSIETKLKHFFSDTHRIKTIPLKNKHINDLPIHIPLLLKLFKKELIYKHLISEWRQYDQSFLICEPKFE